MFLNIDYQENRLTFVYLIQTYLPQLFAQYIKLTIKSKHM